MRISLAKVTFNKKVRLITLKNIKLEAKRIFMKSHRVWQCICSCKCGLLEADIKIELRSLKCGVGDDC